MRQSEMEYAALRRIATLVAQGAGPEAVFRAVADEVAALLDCDRSAIARFETGGTATIMGGHSARRKLGERFPVVPGYVLAAVHETGQPARFDTDNPTAASMPEPVRVEGIRSGLAAPIVVDGELWGAMTVASLHRPFPPETERRLADFTELIASAIANAESRAAVSRARHALELVAAEQAALRRVATLVTQGAAPAEIFAAVSMEVDQLFQLDADSSDVAGVVRFDTGPDLLVVGVSRTLEAVPLGSHWEPIDLFAPALVLRSARSARVDEEDLATAGGPVAEFLRSEGYLSQVASPIVVRGRLWGAISVNSGERLPPDAPDRLEKFTELVATAVANAESYEALTDLAEEQAALRRVATLVARDPPSTEVFEAVATEVGTLLDTDITVVGRYDGDGFATAIGSWSAAPGGVPVGTRSAIGGRNVLTIVAETGKPARVDGYEDASGEAAEIARRHGWRSSIAAPIVVEDRLWGVMLVATQRSEPFPSGAEERLAAFTDLVATAVANTQAHDELRRFGEEQAALGRVATLVAAGAAPEQVFAAVVEEVSSLLGLERIELVRYDDVNTGTVIAASGEHPFPAGSTWSLDDPSVMATVARTRRAARIDDYGALQGEIARVARDADFRSAIGAPMTVDGRLWGVIIAISTDPEPIPERSEARLGQFTDLVATAVANAEARQALERIAAEQATLQRIATLVARGVRPEQVFAAVTEEVAASFQAIATVMRFEHDPPAVVMVGASEEIDPIGHRLDFDHAVTSAEVYRTGRSARVKQDSARARRRGIASTVASPIIVEGRMWGVIAVNAAEELPPDTEERLEKFTELVTTAIANAEGKSELAASRRRIVTASDEARRKIERDLHDGTQQRLVSLGLAVRAAEANLPPERDDLRAQLSGVATGLVAAVEDLQEISRGIHPAILSKGGLAPALRSLAHRSAIPVDLDITADVRLEEPIEVTAYFVASEALANAAKYSEASRIDVSLAQRDGSLVLSVRDDGVGGADAARGSGLVGLTDRVEALGGSIHVFARAGEGTQITAELPLELKPSSIGSAYSESAEPSQPPLLGRDDELRRLYGLIDAIAERGGALTLRGEAGIGKSTLLASASNRARRQGVTVVTTTGTESEARLAFGGLHQLLLSLLDKIDRLSDPQRQALETAFELGTGDPPDLFLIALATLGLVSEATEEEPLLFVVEDAQWLDRPSAEVLAFVGRRLEMEPAILLFAVRDGLPSEIDDAGLPELRLDRLDGDASSALVDAHAPGLPDELKARILAEAAGNPLALIELPSAAAELQLDLQSVPSEPLPLTSRLEQAFASRLPDLGADARMLLLLAALYDGELPELNRAAAELSGGAVGLAAWTQATEAGLGTLAGSSFRFRHPLIRSAVERAATAEERRQAHAALAKALAADPDRAVWHLAAEAAGPDEEVALALDAAADRARLRGGRDIELEALERAADLTPDSGARGLRLHRAGVLAFELGRSNESLRLLAEARELGLPPYERAEASLHLEVLAGTWSGAGTVRGFARAAQEIAETGDDRKALQALENVAVRAYWANLNQETRQHVTGVVDQLDVPADDPIRLAVLGLIDPIERGQEFAERAGRLSPLDFADPVKLLDVGMGASAVWADNLALPFVRAAVAGFRADARLTLLGQALVFEAWGELRRGNVRGAITAAAEGVRLAEDTGDARFTLVAKLAHGIAAAERGEDDVAEQLIAEAEAVLLPMGANPLLALVALARGRHALAAERFPEAYESLARIFDPADAAYQPFVRGWTLADLVDAAMRGDGDLDLVRGFVAEWSQIAATTKALELEVQLNYARAILATDARAEQHFQALLTSPAQTWPFFTARAQLAYGEWLRRRSRAVESHAPLREAARTFEALGHVRLADRARRELRASGERARHREAKAWAQLTPQELQIAELAADGLSNREIGERLYLSHRAVGSHLYRLFPKLGVTSRTQLHEALEPQPDA
jgi:GAF domain-containing protein/DNA-binding CsgD family transcriptional regulator